MYVCMYWWFSLLRHPRLKSKPWEVCSQEFQILWNIDKLTTWPSLTSVQFSAAELFFKMCDRNL